MCQKLIGTLVYLNRIGKCFEIQTQIMIAQSPVLNHINDCSRIWGATAKYTEKDFKNLNISLHDRVCIMYDHATVARKQLEWLKVEEKCVYDLCVLVFKIMNNQLPS